MMIVPGRFGGGEIDDLAAELRRQVLGRSLFRLIFRRQRGDHGRIFRRRGRTGRGRGGGGGDRTTDRAGHIGLGRAGDFRRRPHG